MKITLFTSNNYRHNYLINLLSNICEELWVVQESGTLFTRKNGGKYPGSEIIENYFNYTEHYCDGWLCPTNNGITIN